MSHRGPTFLAGRWAGSGTWGGCAFSCAVETVPGPDPACCDGLTMSMRATRDGGPELVETVVFHAGSGDALPRAIVTPDGGPSQEFAIHELAAGAAYRLVFTPPSGSDLSPQRWTLRRTEAGYEETFEVAPGGGAYLVAVGCTYAPATAPVEGEAAR